jgi:hypothetical protein
MLKCESTYRWCEPVRRPRREKISGALEEREALAAAERFVASHGKALLEQGLDAKRLKLGRPVQVREFSPEQVKAYKKGEPVAKRLQASGEWFVPASDGKNEAFVDVGCCGERIEGRLIGKGFGWAPLAQKWRAVARKWPDALLVSCPPGPAMYYTVPSASRPNLTPFTTFEAGADFMEPKDAGPE